MLFIGLVDFLKALDTRADVSVHSSKHYAMQRKLRRDGVPAETLPPIGAPKWTVSKEWRKGSYIAMYVDVPTSQTHN